MTVYCPVDDKPFDTMEDLRTHIDKAVREGEPNHVDISRLEGWEETSTGLPVKTAADLEET